ncbi:MAG: GTP 3',8-cyclase MoaA [Clostridia bacterium]|nr:GTP 3',8-cyclase MoaA [Lachnospiraceae bacterium]NCB99905.1 GTP 3',8-cyclase MoaA [Clostridia bacterium]NCD03070.1 GTP 3',8-cyclase MoaA [Clostridia bacterium]
MQDAYGRKIEYLRISITERCNLRCQYCMPVDGASGGKEQLLRMDEILRVVQTGAKLGIRYIKVTGGEPLVRKDCVELIRGLKGIPGIEKVTLTTNGVLLKERLQELEAAGVDGINVSLDSMDEDSYYRLTGKDCLAQVLSGIKAAASTDIPVKINCVSIKGQKDWKQILLLAKELPVDVRFIEMMPLGLGKNFETEDHRGIFQQIKERYPEIKKEQRPRGAGPAVYYYIPEFRGCVGFISALHGSFCESCNRVRLTADGYLKTCLSYNEGADLAAVLRKQGDGQEKELEKVMSEAVFSKPKKHCFENPESVTEDRLMGQIGG